MSHKVSLALIVKDEEKNLRDCVKSFEGAFDELVIVDTGSTDRTIDIADELGAKVFFYPKWDYDFAKARQMSFDNCTSEFILWADADDRLQEKGASGIRQLAERNQADIHLLLSNVGGATEWRERLIRRGSGKWVRKIHENFQHNPGAKIARVKGVQIFHPPVYNRKKSHDRNRRILQEITQESALDLFYLATEDFRAGDMEGCKKHALAALNLNLDENFRYEMFFCLALASKEGSNDRIKYALSAFSLCPYRREALVLLCQESLRKGEDAKALGYAHSFFGIQKPAFEFFGIQHDWYGWKGTELFATALRRNGHYTQAAQLEMKARKNLLPNISLIHATRGRPERMIQCRNMWFDRAHNPAMVEHIFCVDGDDSPEVLNAVKDYIHVVVQPGGGCVRAWNVGAEISSGHIMVQLSDDWVPPMHWDKIIIDRLGDKINDEAVLAVSDGIIREDGQMTKCMCMAIMTRARWHYQGHFFHPDYLSVYSDNEFTDRAYEDGVVVEARDVIFEHVHPINGKAAMDSTYIAQNAPERYKQGEAAFTRRKATRWTLRNEYSAFILAAKDDFCLEEVCNRLVEEGVKHLWFAIPTQYWNGTPNSQDNINEVLKIAAKFKGSTCMSLNIESFRAPDRHILITEAMARNFMLDEMRKNGLHHVVVADGDELWLPGTLKLIDQYVCDNNPTSITMRMVPVIGLPGYPIEGAKDAAMVYLGPDCKFSKCRSSEGKQVNYPRRPIIHFTATRKTMDEIIQKHRESGHYGDPDYDFEGWIRHTLPNVKPGFTRAHMYRNWDTWPLVREWTKEEWNFLPDSIKRYLGEPK